MDDSTSVLGQAKRRIGAAGEKEAVARSVRGKIMWAARNVVIAIRLRRGGRTHQRRIETINPTNCRMCVLATAVLLFTAVDAGGLGRDASAAEMGIPPTGNIASTVALSPGPDADGWNYDQESATLRARYKGH